ncbi:dienelactone hydrolase family protein [Nostoc sp.]|uniref:dienelactone hydrolase family protein n=1 Tax=Nostoc sp. TaxID=1180 RepID=UPI002FF6AFA3
MKPKLVQKATSIQQGLKDNPLVTIYRYEGVSHGFSRVGSSTYRKEAAELATRSHIGVFETAFRQWCQNLK